MLFQYTSLSSTEVRLVRLLPYSTPQNPFLSLSHHDLTSSPPPNYTILTCASSQPQQQHTDRQSLTLAGRSFMVPVELHAALSALSSLPHQHRGTTNFWIWELCVNQRDDLDRDRESQPERLAEIVRAADEVLVWLDGNSPERANDVVDDDVRRVLADKLPLGPLLLEHSQELRIISQTDLDGAGADGVRSKV